MAPSIVVGLNAVIVAVTDEEPRLLTVERSDHGMAGPGTHEPALPFGPLDPAGHRTLELGLRAWVREQTGLELGYVEQLYTFADRNRDPRERAGGPRMVSIAYLALVREGRVAGPGQARWRGFYEFLPWEDARAGRPALVEKVIVPALERWVRQAPDAETRRARRERADITFGLRGATFDPVRVLERYELLYEAGLVGESWRDRDGGRRGRPAAPRASRWPSTTAGSWRPRSGACAASSSTARWSSSCCRPPSRCCGCSGSWRPSPAHRLHKQNFRRLVEKDGLVEGTGVEEPGDRGPPRRALPLPPRGAPRAPRAGRGPARRPSR